MVAFPTCIEEVSLEFLNENLRTAGGGGTVIGYTTERIGEGVGLLGKLDRISLQWDGASTDAPETVVGKFATDNEEALAVVTTFNFYEKEVNFYNTLADKTLTRTPEVHVAVHDPATQQFVILMEDASSGEMGDQVTGATPAQVEATAEELVKLHASWWQSPVVAESPFIYDLMHPINYEGIPHALDAYQPISSQILDLPSWYDRYRAAVPSVLERLAAQPFTLAHGDPRLDNLFFGVGDDPLLVIDWQIIIQAPGVYDLAYFMSQSVPIETRRDMEADVITHYFDRLVELDVSPPSRQELWDTYRLACATCLVYPAVGGGTVDPDDGRAVDLVKAMLDRCVTAAEDLGSVALL